MAWTFFIATALIAVTSAVLVITQRKPVYSALFLVLCLLAVAVLFFQLNATFLAALQVIVYAGAIMVLFVFVIMLLHAREPVETETRLDYQQPAAVFLAFLLIAEMGYLALVGGKAVAASTESGTATGVKELSRLLFTNYLLAFELTSVILLVAMVGVVVLGKKRL